MFLFNGDWTIRSNSTWSKKKFDEEMILCSWDFFENGRSKTWNWFGESCIARSDRKNYGACGTAFSRQFFINAIIMQHWALNRQRCVRDQRGPDTNCGREFSGKSLSV